MQTLDEVKLKFKVINAYPGNIKLVEKTTQFFEKNFDGFESEVIEEIKPYYKDLASWEMLKKWVFMPCVDICYFSHNPFKVMKFIKLHLGQFAFSKFIRELIVEVLEDSYRISPILQNTNASEKSIKHIISELKILDLDKPYKFEMAVGLTTLEFLNDGKNYYEDPRKFTCIWMSIEGMMLSKYDVHEQYLKSNFCPELIEAIQKSEIVTLLAKTSNYDDSVVKKPEHRKDIKPIWWKKSDRLLGYLFDELAKADFIDKNTDINQAIKEHFLNKDKDKFSDSIKQNRSGASNINTSGKPKGAKDIDDIIENAPKE